MKKHTKKYLIIIIMLSFVLCGFSTPVNEGLRKQLDKYGYFKKMIWTGGRTLTYEDVIGSGGTGNASYPIDLSGTETTGINPIAKGGTGSNTAAGARTNLGLGTLATQDGTFSGTSSGTNTGDQTISLTGDVTGAGTGSFATTITAGSVALGTDTSGILPQTQGGWGTDTTATVAVVAGEIGIGTTTPGRKLHIFSPNSGGAVFLIEEPFPRTDWYESDAAANNRLWRFGANGQAMNFSILNDASTQATNFLTINRNGTDATNVIFPAVDVGIGTTTPATVLHVIGTITASTGFSGDGSALTNVTATPALDSVDATHLKSTIDATDTNFLVGSLTVNAGNFRLDSTGSATTVTLTVTGTATAVNMTVTNLTVSQSATLPAQESTTGSASVSVGSGQSYTINSTGSSTNTIVLNCSGVISATNTGSMDLSNLQGGVTLGSTTTKLGTVYVTTPYVLINEWSGASYYGTTTTNLWTGTITGGLMGAYDSLWIYTDMEFSNNDSKLVQISLNGVNLASASTLGTTTVSWSAWTTLTNKGTVASNISRSGFVSMNTVTANAFTARTIDTSGNMPLIIRAAHNNLAGTSTLHYLSVILYKKP